MTDLEQYFIYRCQKGLVERGLSGIEKYQKRLDYEAGVIRSMGYPGYFLIVSDILKWAIKQGIPVGVGRGSAGGSLVSYVLYITHLDPIKYGLIFERFLNPSRVTMPDIDLDFCEIRRHEVVDYVRQKYGHDYVANIGTHGTMKAKAAIRDAARTLGLPYSIGDKLAKLTLAPISGKTQDLQTCYEKIPELYKYRYETQGDEQRVLIWAERIEERIKNFGVHASGYIISDEPVTNLIPLYPGSDGSPTTQFEMNVVEEVGLIKFDFLGLRALTTIDRCVKNIAKRYNIPIDPLSIPIDDEKTYRMLWDGYTKGIFQLENSSGLRDMTMKVRPFCLEDLSVLVAVYRPGPLGSPELQHYLKVRQGEATPHYAHEALEPILKETDGLLVYQEQIIEICKHLAGYSASEADIMRKVVGKKKTEAMKSQKKKFVDGMLSNGFEKHFAEQLFIDIENFASYGFNKSHAICYAHTAYQMAYLKANYPLEFICSCMVSDSNESDKIIQYIAECKRMNIKILPPDINKSDYDFTVSKEDNAIRFGLSAIKNIGKPVRLMVNERKRNGPYKDIIDFANRMDLTKFNKRKLECLVFAGAFDGCGYNRHSMIEAINEVIQYKEDYKKYQSKLLTYQRRTEKYLEREKEIANYKGVASKGPKPVKKPVAPGEIEKPKIPNLIELPLSTLLYKERELLGYYVSGHPLNHVVQGNDKTVSIAEIKDAEDTEFNCKLIGIPSIIKEVTTKKTKKKMAYVTLEDRTSTLETIVFPKTYDIYRPYLKVGTPALFLLNVQQEVDDLGKITKVSINNIKSLDTTQEQGYNTKEVKVPMGCSLKLARLLKNKSDRNYEINLLVEGLDCCWNLDGIQTGYHPSEITKIVKELP